MTQLASLQGCFRCFSNRNSRLRLYVCFMILIGFFKPSVGTQMPMDTICAPELLFKGGHAHLTSASRPAMELLRAPRTHALNAATVRHLAKLLACGEHRVNGVELLKADLPHHWSDAELSELQWQPLVAAAVGRRRDLELASPPDGVSHADFVHAIDVATCHGLNLDGRLWLWPATGLFRRSAPHGAVLSTEGTEIVLRSDGAPANAPHEQSGYGPKAASFSNSHDPVDKEAASSESGDPAFEVTLSSGWRSNAQLLLAQGWASASLACDAIEVDEAMMLSAAQKVLEPSQQLRQKQLAVIAGLRRFGYLPGTGDGYLSHASDGQSGCSIFAGGYACDSLGRYLQALSLSENELRTFGEGGCTINIGESVPISCDHERRVGQVLSQLCGGLLGESATSATQDEAILHALECESAGVEARTAHTNRLRACVHARLSRKRALSACRERADAWVQRPTAMASLRRPWRVNIRTSG